ncbi:MAG: hypothetical protein HYY03_01605 [Chloroflexi bacterium]|nr:hypothetical protein [Chloroflexota bacterium]
MLLHVTHTHTAESCPGPHPDRMKTLNAGFSKLEEAARTNDVKVLSVAYAFPEHTGFFVVDAPSTRAAQNFFGAVFPGMLATVHMTPVMDLAEAKQVMADMAG